MLVYLGENLHLFLQVHASYVRKDQLFHRYVIHRTFSADHEDTVKIISYKHVMC